ncbi:hypothetical protein FJT64_002245 [Amphibalanus amphitrite]|uniref:Uncharacterized protein n=1 Tax=Amphibalanus amphitrite TaxID=1232801 RepID=A0A6A4WQX5_AMPAM|nr:hypothetical protein FJT64_002245 [Amphibalanus amphitrite]
MNRDDEEDKTNKKKSQSRSRTRESSGSSDPDFETSAAVGGRRGGYATRRTRQVESDPPPHDLSRILPRDPPDCLRRGTKRKSQSSPRLLCFDPAPEDSGGGPSSSIMVQSDSIVAPSGLIMAPNIIIMAPSIMTQGDFIMAQNGLVRSLSSFTRTPNNSIVTWKRLILAQMNVDTDLRILTMTPKDLIAQRR